MLWWSMGRSPLGLSMTSCLNLPQHTVSQTLQWYFKIIFHYVVHRFQNEQRQKNKQNGRFRYFDLIDKLFCIFRN